MIVGVTLRPSLSVSGTDHHGASMYRVDVLNLPSSMSRHNLTVVVRGSEHVQADAVCTGVRVSSRADSIQPGHSSSLSGEKKLVS